MVVTKNKETCIITVNSRRIDCVDRFCYFEWVVTRNSDTSECSKPRIWSAKSIVTDFDSVWKNKEITQNLK